MGRRLHPSPWAPASSHSSSACPPPARLALSLSRPVGSGMGIGRELALVTLGPLWSARPIVVSSCLCRLLALLLFVFLSPRWQHHTHMVSC